RRMDLRRQGRSLDATAHLGGHAADLLEISGGELRDALANRAVAVESAQRHLEGLRGDDEPRRHAHAGARQLSEAGAFAADRSAIREADLIEPVDVHDAGTS